MTQTNKKQGAIIHRQMSPALDVITVSRPASTDIHVTVRPGEGEPSGAMLHRLADLLVEQNAEPVRMNIFGSSAEWTSTMKALQEACSAVDWPITWIEGGNCVSDGLAGIQMQAVGGIPVETLYIDGDPIGRVFENAFMKCCFLGDVQPADLAATQQMQARQVFEKIAAGLQLAGMDITDLVRTWFHNDHILDWYDEFNQVRTKFFREMGIFDALVPASTGVAGRNPVGAALVACALAIQPTDDSVTIGVVPSPLQCPAPDYGSSFSRAVEVISPDLHAVIISGTASVGPEGDTLYVDDVEGQIARTMEVVEAILSARDMSYADVTRAVAYVKYSQYTSAFINYCADHGLDLPVVTLVGDICRDELLFEIEVDALTAR